MIDPSTKWAINTLNTKGYQVKPDSLFVIQDNPWSKVFRLFTSKGNVFLKKVPKLLSIETKVIKLLADAFGANVPVVIAENPEQCCFLMQDAGIRLHDYFMKEFHPDTLIEAMRLYTQLQINSVNKTQQFLDLTVPDWRIDKLPGLYQNLISQESLLIKEGLSKDELTKLHQSQKKLSETCERLSQFKVKDTFGHADFHDKNILINPDTGKTTIIDLGEVVITHPFFSLNNCLHRIKENFSLPDNQYQQLLHACLEPWLKFEPLDRLLQIISIINECWPIHSVLGEYRLLMSVTLTDSEKLHSEGRLANNLRYWLNLSNRTTKNEQ